MYFPTLWFDRGLSRKGYQQILILAIFIISIILVVFGITWFATAHGGLSWWEVLEEVIAVFIDPGSVWNVDNFKSFPTDAIPDIRVTFISVVGLVLFIGVFISVLSNIFERRVENFRNGEIAYRQNDHIVIIGYNDMVPVLIRQLCMNKEYDGCMILVQSAQNIPTIRNYIFSELSSSQENRVLFICASRGSAEDLLNLYSYKAREVFIIGDDTKTDHDSSNIACLSRLVNIHRKMEKCRRIPFNVLFDSPSTFTAFQLTDLSKNWRQYIEFHPFNMYSEWAKRILLSRKYEFGESRINYPDILTRNESDFTGRESISSDSDKHVHLVIVGMSQMGTSLGIEAAHLLHLTNAYDENDNLIKGRRTVITFIDANAWEEMNIFCNRYHHFFEINPAVYYSCNDSGEMVSSLFTQQSGRVFPEDESDFLDIKFEFIQGRIESMPIHKLIEEWTLDDSQILSIATCFKDPSKSIAAGLYLPDAVYSHNINVFIYQESSCALIDLLGSNETPNKYHHVYPFGMVENAYELGNVQRILAEKINYLYDYYNEHNSLPENFPDESVLKSYWNNKSVSHQWSNIYVSLSIKYKLSCIKNRSCLSDDDIRKMAVAEHSRWCVERLLIGYRKPSAEEMKIICSSKDVKRHYKNELFVHPDLTPYNKLDESSKQYDINIIKGIPLIIDDINKL